MDAGIAVYRYGLKVQAFVFPRTMHTVRIIIDKHGNPWWVAKDVCEVLGIGNVSDAIARLDDDEFDTIEVTDSIGRKQKTYVVNESGLYSLIMTSRKPEAKAFKKWVTAEVLPSIRKTGSYGHNSQQQFDLTNLGHVQGVLAALTVQALEDQETIETLKIETKEVTTLVITPPV
jgi:prophage antirepressor-like protein